MRYRVMSIVFCLDDAGSGIIDVSCVLVPDVSHNGKTFYWFMQP